MLQTTRVIGALRSQYDRDGFVRIPGFADHEVCDAMLARVVAIARTKAAGDHTGPGWVLPEANLAGRDGAPEALVSKIFRLHRDGPFRDFATAPEVITLLTDLLGPRIDCFLSQFIFKNPQAWGQPWHQDGHYFDFEPRRPIVGLWLAVTEATLVNGCLHGVAGSQREPIHDHVDDLRPGANYGYREIVDFDTSSAQAVLMDPGDLLVFDSHLMHRSTDNESAGIRAAMVFHFCATGTIDRANHPINDFMTVAGSETGR